MSKKDPKQIPYLAAYSLAQTAHAGHRYSNSRLDMPYMFHLQAVMLRTRAMAIAPHIIRDEVEQVALLHDILEDTDVTVETLVDIGFNETVIEAVQLLTFKKGEQSRTDYINAIKVNEIALIVKIADTTCNLVESVHDRDSKRITRYANQLIQLTKEDATNG